MLWVIYAEMDDLAGLFGLNWSEGRSGVSGVKTGIVCSNAFDCNIPVE